MLPFLAIQRQRCIKTMCPKDPGILYAAGAETPKGQHRPALELYKNQSPITVPGGIPRELLNHRNQLQLQLWMLAEVMNHYSDRSGPFANEAGHAFLANCTQGRKCAINKFWAKNPRGLLGWGSRGSRQIIYVRIFPNISNVFGTANRP